VSQLCWHSKRGGTPIACLTCLSQPKTQSSTGKLASWDVLDVSPRVREAMNWTEILKRGGVPEPPGYQETLERLRQNPYKVQNASPKLPQWKKNELKSTFPLSWWSV
jgi:hypothetical protein